MNTTSITCTCTHGGGGHAERCPLFVKTTEWYERRITHLEDRERVGNTLRREVLRVAAALRARDRGTQRGLQWAYDAATALEEACKPA